MSVIMGYFSNIKNILMLIVGLFGIGYVAKLKYNASQAEAKLQQVETKIAKTNVIVAKVKAESKAQGKKAETDIHIETLKELKVQSKVIQKEMSIIAKDIKKSEDVKEREEFGVTV